MLRRAPTLITLTPEDVAAYEDSRLARLARASILHNSNGHSNGRNMRDSIGAGMDNSGDSINSDFADDTGGGLTKKAHPFDPNDELKPLPGDKARAVRYVPTTGGASGSGLGQQDTGAGGGTSSTAAAERERERARARDERIGVGIGR